MSKRFWYLKLVRPTSRGRRTRTTTGNLKDDTPTDVGLTADWVPRMTGRTPM